MGAAVWAENSFLWYRPAPKNQILSFQIGPPRVASYVGTTLSPRMTPIGPWDCHLSLARVARKDPLKEFPPPFVTVLMTPPVNRPYSAETPDDTVVVSRIASSMKRLFGVPRTLS